MYFQNLRFSSILHVRWNILQQLKNFRCHQINDWCLLFFSSLSTKEQKSTNLINLIHCPVHDCRLFLVVLVHPFFCNEQSKILSVKTLFRTLCFRKLNNWTLNGSPTWIETKLSVYKPWAKRVVNIWFNQFFFLF